MMKYSSAPCIVNRQFDLEERLIQYAVHMLTLVEQLPVTSAGKHIGHQLLRSGTAPPAVYGEAQSAESRKDFIHKMKIALKELRESYIWLKIIKRKPLIKEVEVIEKPLAETNELISIFVKSINTAMKNLQR
jgi:four helix bundle protein